MKSIKNIYPNLLFVKRVRGLTTSYWVFISPVYLFKALVKYFNLKRKVFSIQNAPQSVLDDLVSTRGNTCINLKIVENEKPDLILELNLYSKLSDTDRKDLIEKIRKYMISCLLEKTCKL